METKEIKLHENFRAFRDYLVTMVPIAALSTYVYGWRVVVMLALAVALSFVSDLLVSLLRGRRYDVTDLSSVTFAVIFTMLMPASVSGGTLIFGVASTLMCKHCFGGYGSYPFHPVAFGYAMTAVSFPEQVFLYPEPYNTVPMGWVPGVELSTGPAYTLLQGGMPKTGADDLIVGNFAGPMGSTFCIVAVSCMVLMVVHKAINWFAPVSFMATCAVWAALFPRVSAGIGYSILLELVCGGIPFAAAYLLAEPTVCPRNNGARLLFGAVVAVFTMLITRYGIYEYGVCAALLICGPLSGWLDRLFTGGRKNREEVTGDEQA